MDTEEIIKILKDKGYKVSLKEDNILASKDNISLYIEKNKDKIGMYVLTEDNEVIYNILNLF